MSFLMLDIDHFKSVNDRCGHVVGDEVLVGLVDLLKRTCRAGDLVGRFGGGEFCIAIMALGADDVEKLAERVRQAVAKLTAWLAGGAQVTMHAKSQTLSNRRMRLCTPPRHWDETGVNWNKMLSRSEPVGRP